MIIVKWETIIIGSPLRQAVTVYRNRTLAGKRNISVESFCPRNIFGNNLKHISVFRTISDLLWLIKRVFFFMVNTAWFNINKYRTSKSMNKYTYTRRRYRWIRISEIRIIAHAHQIRSRLFSFDWRERTFRAVQLWLLQLSDFFKVLFGHKL